MFFHIKMPFYEKYIPKSCRGGVREGWARDGDRTCRPLGLKLIIYLDVAKISSAY
jgi:hypothetical protein